ncbi:high mobility group box 3 [Saguinus oedipus]|uniref:High mobility group box 3 n=1 Tax=Saguinus oedipus TaxID=9490 RepID=A0ABQ9UL71_SAGOE|nr:high mobility group box 3 [Saguinus oedipus]
MSGKEKSKFDEMAKADKVRYDREMKDYGPAKGGKKKDPNAPKSEKQPHITKVAKLKKYEKDVADYKSKGKFDGAKGPAKVARKKVEEEDEDDEEEEEEEEE